MSAEEEEHGRTEIAAFDTDEATAVLLSDLLFELFAGHGAIVSAVETAAGRWRTECRLPAGARWRSFAGGFASAGVARGLAGLPPPVVTRVDAATLAATPAPGFAPVRAGRFLVHDRAHRPGATGGTAIEIEAGLAFGTGHHATTEGCLAALDAALKQRGFRRPLDLGCGSGILAIAAALALRVPVTASDIDPVAVAVARDNARLNAAGPLVRCVVADGLDHPELRRPGGFDLVLANILAGPLVALAAPLARAAAPGATVILSGLLAGQCARVEARYLAAGFRRGERRLRKEWATLTFFAPGSPEGGEEKRGKSVSARP